MPKENTARPLQQAPSKFAHIPGWGSDLNQRPGVPRELNQENVLSPDHHRAIRGKQKPIDGQYLTLERSAYPPVLGNSHSPAYVSKFLRQWAFLFSEDSLRHWFLLLFADRVNVVEGWVEDIGKGKMPMVLPRMEFRTTDHLRRILEQGPKNRQDKLLLAGAAATLVGAGALAYWLLNRPERKTLPSLRSLPGRTRNLRRAA